MNKIKHFVAHDGNKIGLFDSLREAEKAAALYEGWTEEEFEKEWDSVKKECEKYGGDPLGHNGRDSLYFFDELEINESGEIVKINRREFNDMIAENSDDEGTPEFEKCKKEMTEYYLGDEK